MAKTKTDPTPAGYVQKGTLYIVAVVCVALGFFGGIVFSALKSVPNPPIPGMGASRQTEAPPAASSEQMLRVGALEEETKKVPEKSETWAELGNAYFDAGQSEKAIQAYEKSLALKPDNADVMTDMGVMYRRMGQPQKAIAAFERAMAADPRHEISRYNKGIILLHDLSDMEGAISAWEDLVRINPDYKAPTGQTIKQMVEAFKSRKNMGASKEPNPKS